MNLVNDNGTLRPATHLVHSAEAPAALFGDGLFETIRYGRTGALLWDAHWARLSAGMEALLFQAPAVWNSQFFHEEISRTVQAGAWHRGCRVRLHVYASAIDDVRFSISCGRLPAPTDGVALGISSTAVKDLGPCSHLKVCNALPYRIARREATMAGWDEAAISNSLGAIVETTKSNILLSQAGTVFVNPLTDGPTAGVMRAQAVTWMQEWGYSIQESSFKPSMLFEADEIFLTNALRGVMPVRRLFSHKDFGERTFSTVLGHMLAQMVEQKFMAFER